MSFFQLTASVIVITAHAYLLWKIKRWIGGGWWQYLLLLGLAAVLSLHFFRRFSWGLNIPLLAHQITYIWLGAVLVATGVFLAFDLARVPLALLRLFGGPDLAFLTAPARSTPVLLFAALILVCYGLYNAGNYTIVRQEIHTGKLPPGVKRIRIAALTDIHLGMFVGAAQLEKMLETAQAENPDLLVVVGDLVDTNMRGRKKEAELLRSFKAPKGKYAVLGNHEAYRGLKNSRDFIASAGLTLLENRAAESGGIVIVGISDPAAAQIGNPEKILQKLNRKKFIILLKHRPTLSQKEIGLFELQISGHTHGGQIWPGAVLVKRRNGQVEQGMNTYEAKHGKSLLYVSDGAGFWGPPMRLGTRAEITIFDLVSEI